MNKKTIIGAITFPIPGQTLILGIGAILFASRSLSRTNTNIETDASKQNDDTVEKLTLEVLNKLIRKKRKKERKEKEEERREKEKKEKEEERRKKEKKI